MKRDPQLGMSLLEVTVVVMMILVLSAIAIPGVVSARNSYRLQIATDAIRQQLYLCRQHALVANQLCSIQIGATGKSKIDTNHNGTFGDGGGDGIPADEPATRLDLTDITLSSADTPIVRRFTSRGEVSWQDGPENQSITVIHAGMKRVITIQQRGAISIGDELRAS